MNDNIIAFLKNENEFSHEKIKDHLVLHSLNLMNDCVDNKVPLAKSLEQNKMIWGRLMFQNKKI